MALAYVYLVLSELGQAQRELRLVYSSSRSFSCIKSASMLLGSSCRISQRVGSSFRSSCARHSRRPFSYKAAYPTHSLIEGGDLSWAQ